MSEPECSYCGAHSNDADLENFGGLFYCKGWCLDTAKDDARINERDKELEDRRLWKSLKQK